MTRSAAAVEWGPGDRVMVRTPTLAKLRTGLGPTGSIVVWLLVACLNVAMIGLAFMERRLLYGADSSLDIAGILGIVIGDGLLVAFIYGMWRVLSASSSVVIADVTGVELRSAMRGPGVLSGRCTWPEVKDLMIEDCGNTRMSIVFTTPFGTTKLGSGLEPAAIEQVLEALKHLQASALTREVVRSWEALPAQAVRSEQQGGGAVHR